MDEELDERRLLLEFVPSSPPRAPWPRLRFCKDVLCCVILSEVDGEWVEDSVLEEGFKGVELDGPAEMSRSGG